MRSGSRALAHTDGHACPATRRSSSGSELEAYRRAQLHLFLLPGEAKSATLTNLVSTCLADMCTAAVGRPAQCWKLTASGLIPFPIPPKRQRTK